MLSLFFGCFTVIFGTFGVLGDLFPGFLSWGYTFGLIALAALVGGLLTYARALGSDGSAGCPGCSARPRACFTPGRARR